MVYELRRRGGRSPRPKPESCSRWARGTLRIHARRAVLFQSIKPTVRFSSFCSHAPYKLIHSFLRSAPFKAARRRTRYALEETERQSGGHRKTTIGKCLKRR